MKSAWLLLLQRKSDEQGIDGCFKAACQRRPEDKSKIKITMSSGKGRKINVRSKVESSRKWEISCGER